MLRRTIILVAIFNLILIPGIWAQQTQPAETASTPTPATVEYGVGKPAEKILIDFANLPPELSIEKWRIKLSGYSDIPKCRNLSDVKIVKVDPTKLDTDIKFDKCLGIRINFEYSHGNDWAQIYPLYPVSVFYAKEGEGILRNVGPIKSISIWVSGRNYKNSIEVRMLDQNGKYKSINFGHLFFKGWRKLTWENPNYIKELKKRDLVKPHLYPQYEPYLKFESLVIYKSPQEIGGDFVTYVKDIRVEYEPAITKYEAAINDESEWRILEENAKLQRELEEKRLDLYFSGSSMEAEYLKEKMQREKKKEVK